MREEERIIGFIKELQEAHDIQGEYDVDFFCKELGLSVEGVVYLLANLTLKMSNNAVQTVISYKQLKRRYDLTWETLKETYESGRTAQIERVKNGYTTASKMMLRKAEYNFYKKIGYTEEKIMEEMQVSRTTLWRWKKAWSQAEAGKARGSHGKR